MKYILIINPPNVIGRKKKGVSQNGQTPKIIGICSYCVLDRPVFEWNQVLLHPELTPWWSFLFADGAHHKNLTAPPTQFMYVDNLEIMTFDTASWIILCMGSANERRRYNVTSSPIDWAHTQNDPQIS